MAGKGTKRQLRLNILGLLLFLPVLTLFFCMGGGRWAVAEVLPGQAEGTAFAAFLPKGEAETAAESTAEPLGRGDISFSAPRAIGTGGQALRVTAEELARMSDFSYLRQHYFIVDSRTALLESDINAEEALSMDFTVEKTTDAPKVLLFHTHSHEGFADSDMSKGLSEGIWGVGERLKEILEEEYGIAVLHDDGQYDVVDGKGQITGAYERMEPAIRQILAENPSIEVCIDLHRDGVAEGTRLVTEVDGKPCAQVMFFDGLCRLQKNGAPQPIAGLENPYLRENLAFGLQLKTTADSAFSGFARKNYLGAYRFSLHMLPRSVLIEVGAQTNTKAEAQNAMEPLAAVLAAVLLAE